ncbi:zinc ribbon domain-containing protein, partial [Peptacetobacter sp. AB800]
LQLNSIEFTYINPAYTSQICSKCGRFGVRNGDSFVCEYCGEIHADINASKNILDRKYDKEIKMFTSYKKVKEIL